MLIKVPIREKYVVTSYVVSLAVNIEKSEKAPCYLEIPIPGRA